MLLQHAWRPIFAGMSNAHWRGLSIALLATAACGGEVLEATPDAGSDAAKIGAVDGSSPQDAGSPEASPPDVATPPDGAGAEEVGPVCGGSWSTVFSSFADPNGTADVWVFDRQQDFLDFIRNIAVQHGFADPTTGVTCIQIDTCPYDPRLPRMSPQDVHQSNALNQFIGPDGRSYVWTWYQPLNQWFEAAAGYSPQGYAQITDYNAGCLPDCACDAG